ncbi:hypothetical protein [Marinobacterium arenosum]|uniref:hypothetical protein n=1 Tax=Marinobacterium arenosum TaxID=2862496 RepID=UPI001C96BCBA|nr:hypothetical protein [Marinobacterium arenosum]MBY4678438.1 hypothetical protein [Marinobacterium arenosum]
MKKQLLILATTTLLAMPTFADQGHHGNKHKQLPPGLQKKVDRGEALPQGWQKKLAVGEVLERRLYNHAEVIEPAGLDGIATILLDDRQLRVMQNSLEIIEILQR